VNYGRHAASAISNAVIPASGCWFMRLRHLDVAVEHASAKLRCLCGHFPIAICKGLVHYHLQIIFGEASLSLADKVCSNLMQQ
jgi:hypothetical protein